MTTERNIVIYAGAAFALSLPFAGATGRGQRMKLKASDAAGAATIQSLTYNGATNARVIFNAGTQEIDCTIGASVSAAWTVGANRVEWVFDVEDYGLTDTDDVVIPYRGKAIVYGNRT